MNAHRTAGDPGQRSWLVVLDLNGTLVEGDGPVERPVLAMLALLRRLGHRLVLATGNSREYMRRLLQAELAAAGALPDGVVYEHGAITEEIFGGSSDRIEYGPTQYLVHPRKVLPERAAIVTWLRRHVPDAHFQANELAICLDGGTYPESLAERVRMRWPGWCLTFNGTACDIYPSAVSKQKAVARLARRWAIPRTRVFAMGDGLNDLELLYWAGQVAAPANAVADVVALVQRRGGYVARAPYGDGVIEAIQRWLGSAS